ncbi:SDR family oxidoreductase [Sulfidibacter corallicola]|uniref:SDR family oxidoreductase n=1 Tax=Sulfidibacter corallicola TaxID=2818388 RepID=A0A8A4TFL2_SULCO|nr:glucose 1-dehydrogenase [Sulfidibacter corallicola]QTD47982.1 SDR family oxidoreductase [Sulfidibacter corallicola]
MTTRYQGKTVLITGGANGIGRAAALSFAAEGAQVVIGDIATKAGEATIRDICDAGGKAHFFQTDVAQAIEVDRLIEKTLALCDRIDCAFNNAGISGKRAMPLAHIREDEWDRIMEINVKGIWLCMRRQIPIMVRQGQGAIVNTASFLGLTGTAIGLSSYVASKHAVVGLTRAAASEYARKGVRINSVCPGFVETPMVNSILSFPAMREKIERMHALGRLGSAQEVVNAVLWLCSAEASFVTGHDMVVDGGCTAKSAS